MSVSVWWITFELTTTISFFTLSTKTLGKIGVNRFKVGNITNDFSISGIKSALAENDIPCKNMYSDIGIMQKLSSRIENG